MRDGKERQIINDGQRRIEERKTSDDVVHSKNNSAHRATHLATHPLISEWIKNSRRKKRVGIMLIIRPNNAPNLDNKPRSMTLKESSSRTKAVNTRRQRS